MRVLERCGFVPDNSAVTTMTLPNLDGGIDTAALYYRRSPNSIGTLR